jgi:hypothetical protein
MGYDSKWDDSTWKAYTHAHVDGKTADKIFTSRSLPEEFDPALINLRESRDSDISPQSTSISLFLDVTGSMGMLAETMMRDGLNTTATELMKRAPVSDPQIMLGAVGDAETDTAPLQLTQWESSTVLAEQTRRLYIEGRGGANAGESYMLPHVFHAFKTETDCWSKRRKKGFLVTIGDEPTLDGVTRSQAKRFLGIDLQSDLSAADCIALASERYEILHVVVAQGSGCSGSRRERVIAQWNSLLPQRVLILDDHTKLAETIVSAIQVIEGASKSDVSASWGDRSTSLVVASAVSSLAERATAKGIRRIGR